MSIYWRDNFYISLDGSKIPDKIFGTKWNNPVKLDRRRKVCYLFCVFLIAIGKV